MDQGTVGILAVDLQRPLQSCHTHTHTHTQCLKRGGQKRGVGALGLHEGIIQMSKIALDKVLLAASATLTVALYNALIHAHQQNNGCMVHTLRQVLHLQIHICQIGVEGISNIGDLQVWEGSCESPPNETEDNYEAKCEVNEGLILQDTLF